MPVKDKTESASLELITADDESKVVAQYSFTRPSRIDRLEMNTLYNLVAGALSEGHLGTTVDLDLYCMIVICGDVTVYDNQGKLIKFPPANSVEKQHLRGFDDMLRVEYDVYQELVKAYQAKVKSRFAERTLLPDAELSEGEQSDNDLKKSV